ncbi:hypothetical protein ACFQU2_10735 [Siccirubricoccus deserti]
MSSAKKLPVLSSATTCWRQLSDPSSAPIRSLRVVTQPARSTAEVAIAIIRLG